MLFMPILFSPNTNWQETLNTSVAWFFIATEGAFLVLYFAFMFIGKATERMTKYAERFGSTYESLNYKDAFIARFIPTYFIVKRIMFAIMIF
jgi:hypothetical protein